MKLNKFSETLQQVITPKVLGLFWITNEEIETRPFPFEEIDYYLDGLLTKYYINLTSDENELRQKDKKCFFVTNSFAHPFFVVHLNSTKDTSNDEIDELDDVLSKLKTDRSDSIIILQNDDNKLTELIRDRFNNYELTTLMVN